jgi:phosphatidylserine decarboxylase
MHDETLPPYKRIRLPGLDPAATPVVGVGLGLTGLVLGLRPRLAAVPLALTALAALLLRDPDRKTQATTGALYAPADGAVVAVEDTYEHRFLHTDATRITIACSVIDVAVQRSPASGRVAYLSEVAADHSLGWASRFPQIDHGVALLIGLDTGAVPMLIAIRTNPLIRQLPCHVGVGDVIEAGARLSTARLGAYVDLLLPCDLASGIPQIGEHVQAGVSRMAQVGVS